MSISVCYYCGEPADTKDHLEARTWTGHTGKGWRGAWVPACRECNTLLTDFRIPNPDERRAYIARVLPTRYRTVLRGKQWTTEELDELEGSLRAFVADQQAQREVAERRVLWAAGVVPFGQDDPGPHWIVGELPPGYRRAEESA
jgi:hypothetical protein